MAYNKQRSAGFKNGRPLGVDGPRRRTEESAGRKRQEGRQGGTKKSDPDGRRGQSQGGRKPYGSREEQGGYSERAPRAEKRREERPAAYVQPAHEMQPAADEAELPLILYGRNPVREAIRSGRSIDRILVSAIGAEDGSLREIVRMARDAGVIVSEVTRQKLDELCLPYGYAGKPANHQGIVARMPECQYVDVEDILEAARQKGEDPFVLVLDSINDPHNLGSIIRTAVCAGAHGVIIPKRRAASVTAAAAKASAGAVVYMPVARVSNLVNAVEQLKKAGLWIAGADAQGAPMEKTPLAGPLALVIGGEDEGISRLLLEKCDFIASIPMKGEINSLNASVAAAVMIYEKLRQDCAARP